MVFKFLRHLAKNACVNICMCRSYTSSSNYVEDFANEMCSSMKHRIKREATIRKQKGNFLTIFDS